VPNVLEIRNLSKEFGEGDTKVHALKDVSFEIQKGQFVLVVGSSGSGKSTLLNMIGLLDKPTSGTLCIDGNETSDLDDNQVSLFRNKKLGFIFQFSNLLSDLTILENTMLPRKIAKNTENLLPEAMELLKIVGLEEQIHKLPNKISGGQLQRAAVARGLINRPSIVLADEPTGNLDSDTTKTIVQLMKTMAKKFNQTFIVVTHERDQFGKVDRIITISDGRAFENNEREMEVKVA